MGDENYVSAAEAAVRLGVSLPTLYAYVSRGMLRSETGDASRRTRRYHAGDVERLRQRQEQRRDPQRAVDEALHWGVPMLDSALTLIEGGRLFYRGQNALTLAETWSVEEVAALLWTNHRERAEALFDFEEVKLPDWSASLLACSVSFNTVDRIGALLPLLSGHDPAAYDLRPDAAARSGARLLRQITAIAAGHAAPIPIMKRGIVDMLQRAWARSDPGTQPLISLALILCADHELNVSSFTARCVASAGSNPYSVVSAGLAALQGTRHGGATERVASLLREVEVPERAAETLAARLRRGEEIPGFGHRLYPQGDPRGRLLLARARSAYPASAAIALAQAVTMAGSQVLNERPNLDFGLVSLCSAAGFPPDAPLTLFALGRTLGWIAHAIEEYSNGRLIRPRARYVGPEPQEE